MANAALKHVDDNSIDPKEKILKKLGDIDRFEVCNNDVLLAIYQRPRMTPGGILMPDQNLKEDLYQAKVHLVVRMGPSCEWPSVEIKLHDWVVIRPSDGWAIDVNMRPDVLLREDYVPCRMIQDKYVRVKIPNPAMVW